MCTVLQDCHEKTNVLEEHESQVLKLTTNGSRARCRDVASNNGTNILCQGSVTFVTWGASHRSHGERCYPDQERARREASVVAS